MKDFAIEFAPNGVDFRLTVRADWAGVPAAGQGFPRTPPNLDPLEVSQLRGGAASPTVVRDQTVDVSNWLFGVDLNPLARSALGLAQANELRLVFSTNDESVLSALSDVSLELCDLTGGVPLALHNKVAAIVHLLPKVGIPPVSATAGTWPLRVLVVRSNPRDLGGGVPPASFLRRRVADLLVDDLHIAPDLVQVHLLSSEPEPNLSGKPTLEAFRRQLLKSPYDVLIYLGHGDLMPTYAGQPPVGVLQFETDDGLGHVTVPFDQLATMLHERPVPVVLLVGCLTAADVDADMRDGVDAAIPQWMRGSQAVAQALINSESGVQFAVGMRYRIDAKDAELFLKAFFWSLLVDRCGHLEAAVRAGRRELKASGSLYGWSAPMVFRSLGNEPFFPFLADPPKAVCPHDEQHESLRAIFWEKLSQLAWNLRAVPQSGAATLRGMLDGLEAAHLAGMVAKVSSVLRPTCVEGHHSGLVTMPVELLGTLTLDRLRGDVAFPEGHVKVQSIAPTEALLASGYRLLSAAGDGQASFLIERNGGAGALAAGPLFTVTLELGPTYQTVYPATINLKWVEPDLPVCAVSNAVIVPPP